MVNSSISGLEGSRQQDRLESICTSISFGCGDPAPLLGREAVDFLQ